MLILADFANLTNTKIGAADGVVQMSEKEREKEREREKQVFAEVRPKGTKTRGKQCKHPDCETKQYKTNINTALPQFPPPPTVLLTPTVTLS